VMKNLQRIAERTFAPEHALKALESLAQSSARAQSEIERSPDFFLERLAELLVVSPPMLDSFRSYPQWVDWLRSRLAHRSTDVSGSEAVQKYEDRWRSWEAESGSADVFAGLRRFKQREYIELACLDVAGLVPFRGVVEGLSDLADFIVGCALDHCWRQQVAATQKRDLDPEHVAGFAVFAMGKLGSRELNYSSDIDLVFCRQASDDPEEQRFNTRLAERVIHELSRFGSEGFLYRVDMRLRPLGATGPLVPTLTSLLNYYESWGEAWERQALIKLRPIAGDRSLGARLFDFARRFTFARQMDEAALEEIKQVKYRSEREYALNGGKFHVKQGPGGIRDIEFYVQYLQLVAGPDWPEARASATLDALQGLDSAKMLLEGELSRLSLGYLFLRTVEHRLQLRSLTPQSIVPSSRHEVQPLACSLGFSDETFSAIEQFNGTLEVHRASVRTILERIYLTPGFLRPGEREQEFVQLLSGRTPRERVRELLTPFGFEDADKARQNLQLIGVGPAGRLLPASERRAFLQHLIPLLEVLRDSIDPDHALHNLESFLTAAGNRLSFLRSIASRRSHLVRLTNLLALSNLSHQILCRHPEYFDALARGIHLHEGRRWEDMRGELQYRLGASPRGEAREMVLRRFRQREMIRIAYRDLASLADPLEVSRELSGLAEACVHTVVHWTRPSLDNVAEEYREPLKVVALGKFGSRQMHYSSDLDLMFLYDSDDAAAPEKRAKAQQLQDDRVESIVQALTAPTREGAAYKVDLRLRPEGGSGLPARSWPGFLKYASEFMQPWERMALVRSRVLGRRDAEEEWASLLNEIVYGFEWDQAALESIRHLKRRIEAEKNRESRTRLDFKYGRGGIVDLEFLVQFLQILHGPAIPEARTPRQDLAIEVFREAGILSDVAAETLISAHRFQRHVENHYQLIEEWSSRDVSRDSPVLIRLARSLGYDGESGRDARASFLRDWDARAEAVRALVVRLFYDN
jgi:[glutamine synthetase] adenylyltransferase / [glutamine synthetase]-adenylyl-L-tyrosine phosphorylase